MVVPLPLVGKLMSTASRPIDKYKPTARRLGPSTNRFAGVLVPSLDPCEHTEDDLFKEWALETQQWLDLVSLQSPQVLQNDQTDPYLSRYQVREGPAGPITQDIITVTWQGFISSSWVRSLLVHVKYAMDCFKALSSPLLSDCMTWLIRLQCCCFKGTQGGRPIFQSKRICIRY